MKTLRDLRGCRRGLAAVEFAILLPVMMLLLCGVVEMTNLFTVDRKVVAATQSCADLVAQEKIVDPTKLDEIARAVQLTLDPSPSSNVSFRVSSVVFDQVTGAPRIDWQRVVGGFNGSGRPSPTVSAAGLGLPGESVIIVDLAYSYTPIFENVLPQTFAINELAAARPRRVRVIACNGC